MKPRDIAIQTYRPGEYGDSALVGWYSMLVVSEDLVKLVGASLYPLGAFMRQFTDPSMRLWYMADKDGWWIVAWVMPLMGGGSWGLWVREDRRHNFRTVRDAGEFILRTLGASLEMYPVLVNVTKQEAIVAKTARLGYTYMGMIPHLFDGEPCHVLSLTREQFAAQRLEK